MVNDTNPDIIGRTETWTDTTVTEAELGLSEYVMFRKDRKRQNGEER